MTNSEDSQISKAYITRWRTTCGRIRSVADKKPFVVVFACAREILGVAPPEDTIGAVAVTLVTDPALGVTQVRFPAVSPDNNSPLEAGFSGGKIKL